MSIFGTPLGMNPVDNPLVISPYSQGDDQDIIPAPPGNIHVITEIGEFTITELGDYIVVE